MTFNPYKLIKYHLYLLQLENYELGRFWKLLIKCGWFLPKELRKDLVWTSKARALFVLAIVFHLAFIFSFFVRGFWLWGVIFFVVLFFLYPMLFTLALIIICPLDFLVKKILSLRAAAKINGLPDLKIIGIAGSYGKTTMKEVLKAVLSIKFKVLSTPESVNTPVGIARWILSELDNSAQVLVVEMGEHYKGDVKELCGITRPDISVVTGINESHLERMKTLDNVIATIFEIVACSKPKSLVMLNADDALVMKHYKEFIWPDHRVEQFKIENLKLKNFNIEKLDWEAEFEGIGKVGINLLGEYALGDVDAAIKIAQSLNMSAEEIKKGIANIKPVDHRLQPVKGAGNVLIIDDAYNGNPAGVAEAIKVLSRFEGRRKIYITPGLVEMGKASADVHRTIGKQLASVADAVILIKNSVTPFIAEGIQTTPSASGGHPSLAGGDAPQLTKGTPRSSPPFQGGVPGVKPGEVVGTGKPEIIWFNTAQEAHSSLGKILKTGDVVLFQNDWGDNYI